MKPTKRNWIDVLFFLAIAAAILLIFIYGGIVE